MSDDVALQFSLRVDWSDVDAVPVEHVNQLLGQLGPPLRDGTPDGIYLTFGSVPPPLIIGQDDAERQKVAAELSGGSVKVNVHGRFHMDRVMLDAIVEVLQTAAKQYDATVQLASAENAKN